MELELQAREIVLDNIRKAVPSRWAAKAQELRQLREEGHGSLQSYLEASGLELEDVYSGTKSWSDLNEAAGAPVKPAGPNEAALRKSCGRVLHVDDAERLSRFRELLSQVEPPKVSLLELEKRRVARMLIAAICGEAVSKTDALQDGVDLLWQHPQIRAELIELFGVLQDRIDHQHFALETHPSVPLRIHARYSRLEILAAFQRDDFAKVAPWQSGVLWIEEEKTDLFAFTLDKSNGRFSPTTRYRDFAISRELIHWESQSVTRADSDTGLRYQHHVKEGSTICLFARLRQDDRAFWFLGPASYVDHTGERPMAVTWRLHHPLPGDVYASFAAAVA
jgi:hypothetical protein